MCSSDLEREKNKNLLKLTNFPPKSWHYHPQTQSLKRNHHITIKISSQTAKDIVFGIKERRESERSIENVTTVEEALDEEVAGEEEKGVEAFLHNLSWIAPILSYTSLLSLIKSVSFSSQSRTCQGIETPKDCFITIELCLN